MALKLYETLSLQDAEAYIEQSPKSASKMKKRLRDTMRRRMQTLAKHGLQETEGYRWMESAMRDSLGPVNAFMLSRMTNILGSQRTSYTGFVQIQKRALESLNLEFGTWTENQKTGEQELSEPFITDWRELGAFYDLLHWYKDNVVGFAYSAKQKGQIEDMWAVMRERGLTWADTREWLEREKERYYDSGEQPDIDSIIKSYLDGDK